MQCTTGGVHNSASLDGGGAGRHRPSAVCGGVVGFPAAAAGAAAAGLSIVAAGIDRVPALGGDAAAASAREMTPPAAGEEHCKFYYIHTTGIYI